MTPKERRKTAVNFALGVVLISGAIVGFRMIPNPILPVVMLVGGLILLIAAVLAWVAEGYQRGDED